MTYNIHGGVGRDKQYNLDRIIRVIEAESPDVVTLQEVEKRSTPHGIENQAEIIADALGMNYFFCINGQKRDKKYGIATLTRLPIKRKAHWDISRRPKFNKPRGLTMVDVEMDTGQMVHIFNVHLGIRIKDRRFQLRQLLSDSILLSNDLANPIILQGDFNDQFFSVVHPRLKRHYVNISRSIRSPIKNTFKWKVLRMRLDHIYIDPLSRPLEAYIVRSKLARMASDHYPLVATVQIHQANINQFISA